MQHLYSGALVLAGHLHSQHPDPGICTLGRVCWQGNLHSQHPDPGICTLGRVCWQGHLHSQHPDPGICTLGRVCWQGICTLDIRIQAFTYSFNTRHQQLQARDSQLLDSQHSHSKHAKVARILKYVYTL
jgi:hypothetical protein